MARARRTTANGTIYGVSYARQSLTRDGSESRESQVAVNQETADRFGVELVATLVEPESTSAYKNRGRSRPMFAELLELIAAGKAQVVVCYKSDRMSRGGGPGWAPLLEAAEAAGLDLDRFLLTPAGFMSEFEIGIRATMDREESRKTGDRIADVKYRQALQGKPTGGGRRPFGYRDSSYSGIVKAEAKLLREARDRVVGGEPLQAIAKDWNRRGLRTPGSSSLWSSQHLGRILRGPHLAGFRVVDGSYVQAAWEPIYTREDHEAVLAAKGELRLPQVKRHLLTGILTCGTCGSRMQSKLHSKYGLRYECRRRAKQEDGASQTGCVTISAVDVEYVVKEAVLRRLDSPAVRAEIAAASHGATGRDLTKQITAAKARLDEATDDYYATPRRISRSQFLSASETLNAEIDELSARLSRQRVAVRIPNTSKAIRAAYEGGDLEYQRSLITAAASHVVIHRAKPQGQAELPVVVPGKRSGRPVDAARIEPFWRA